ncbi:hypothetical protein MBLNU230_g8191t1 [Neophaeotheca triangularis]
MAFFAQEPPSTPNGHNFRFSQPSTTPAGPPPSHLTHKSFTPAGQPPKSAFGSSAIPSANTFNQNRSIKGFGLPSSPPQEASEMDMDGDDDMIMGADALPQSSGMGAIGRDLVSKEGPQSGDEDPVVTAAARLVTKLARPQSRGTGASSARGANREGMQWMRDQRRRHGGLSTKGGSIGPASDAPVAKAGYLASFMLQLHEPFAAASASLPASLMTWINENHVPYGDDYETIINNDPTPSHHDNFWDCVYGSLLRGRFERVEELLDNAGWEEAVTAIDDGADVEGYADQQLDTTREVATQCVEVLARCPAARNQNWDVVGAEWAMFRQHVRRAREDLEALVEDPGFDGEESGIGRRSNVFGASRGSEPGFADSMRRAASRVPWSIYENLKVVYGMVLGQVDEIVLPSQDWLEATIFCTVWWDGDTAEPYTASAGPQARKAIANHRHTREVDVAPMPAYKRRMRTAFARVTNEPEDAVFSVDTMDPVQVGLACAMVDDIESVVYMLQCWSVGVCTVLIEVATLCGWLPYEDAESQDLLQHGFSTQDLGVLSYGAPPSQKSKGLSRDRMLATLASTLSRQQETNSSTESGWQLAILVLSRLADPSLAERHISNVLNSVSLENDDQVNQVMAICNRANLHDHARAVCERYADQVASVGEDYCSAMLYYSYANAWAKLDQITNTLTFRCITESSGTALGASLSRLESMRTLNTADNQHALLSQFQDGTQNLSTRLAGCAMLKEFYELRDSASANQQNLQTLGAMGEKLMILLSSAADSIHGGLFDPAVRSLIPVDCLLALLGETLPLLNDRRRVFNREAVLAHLMPAVEYLEQGPAYIFERNAALLSQSLEAYELGRKQPGSKGWDWRKGFVGVHGVKGTGKELVMLVRLALCREMAKE